MRPRFRGLEFISIAPVDYIEKYKGGCYIQVIKSNAL